MKKKFVKILERRLIRKRERLNEIEIKYHEIKSVVEELESILDIIKT